MAFSCAKGSVDSRPSFLAFPQPKKLPPPVLGSGAPVSDKTSAAAPLSHACIVETGQRMVALAYSGLDCGISSRPGLGKAQVSASQGNPLKLFGPVPSIVLGQGSPICSPCRRRRTPVMSSAIAKTPQLEAASLLEVSPPAKGITLPPSEARKPQGMLPQSPISLRMESSSSSIPLWGLGFERERGSCFGLLESMQMEVRATPSGHDAQRWVDSVSE